MKNMIELTIITILQLNHFQKDVNRTQWVQRLQSAGNDDKLQVDRIESALEESKYTWSIKDEFDLDDDEKNTKKTNKKQDTKANLMICLQ